MTTDKGDAVARLALRAAIDIFSRTDLMGDNGVHCVGRAILAAFTEIQKIQRGAEEADENLWLDAPHIVATALWFQMTGAGVWQLDDDISPYAKGANPLLAFARVMTLAAAASELSSLQDAEDGEIYICDNVAGHADAIAAGLITTKD